MVHLTLVGLSEDRARLLLVDDAGTEFTLDVDSQLRAVLRGEHARLGQLEIEMESSLRPRDIQARIRAGETAESVAAAAKTTVEKIMAFAGPVLAERAHLAERALRASIRRRRSGDGPARTSLGEAVTAHLHQLNVATDSVEWDAFRREDGRWTLTGSYVTGRRKGTAHFAYDAPGNFVVAENDDAHWLVGDVIEASERDGQPGQTAERHAVVKKPRSTRRLSSVPSDELPLGDDALEMIRDDEPDAEPVRDTVSDDSIEIAGETTGDVGSLADPDSAVEVAPAAESALPAEAELPLEEDPDASDSESAGLEEPAVPPARTPRKKGRASVPSWDEIMFGGGSGKSD